MRRKLSLARNIKCDTCQGRGTKSGRQYTCEVDFHRSRQHACVFATPMLLLALQQDCLKGQLYNTLHNLCVELYLQLTMKWQGEIEMCSLWQTCHGSGVQVMMRPLGPGMMQQIQQPCSRCNQTGYATPPHDTCADCQGKVRAAMTSRLKLSF